MLENNISNKISSENKVCLSYAMKQIHVNKKQTTSIQSSDYNILVD